MLLVVVVVDVVVVVVCVALAVVVVVLLYALRIVVAGNAKLSIAINQKCLHKKKV